MKRKILIVEDDLVHRDHLARLITRLGHDPVLLSSGQDALDTITKRRDPSIAAVILDLVMPDLDGMGVITRLRAAGYRTPIIVLVKPSALDSALAAIGAGAQDFCLIPAGFERVAVSLKNIHIFHGSLPGFDFEPQNTLIGDSFCRILRHILDRGITKDDSTNRNWFWRTSSQQTPDRLL